MNSNVKRALNRGELIIGIDADDTLWENEAGFDDIQNRFFKLMHQWSEVSETHSLLLKTERLSIPKFGYGVQGFVRSMITTSIELSAGEISASKISEIISWGDELIDAPVDLLPGVKKTLQIISKTNQLLLITKGDNTHQRAKVAASGIAHFFCDIEVVGEKNTDTYKSLLKRHRIEPLDFVMVGNSVVSDVLPVIAIGSMAVHIPHHSTWELEIPKTEEIKGIDFPVLETIEELPILIESWTDIKNG